MRRIFTLLQWILVYGVAIYWGASYFTEQDGTWHMTAKYCADTSGLSHPYEEIPEDIHASLWKSVKATIAAGHVAVTKEIFDEIIQIQGSLGDYLNKNKALIVHEV